MNLNVTLVAASHKGGGSERCVSLLAKGFKRAGDNVDLVSFSSGALVDWLRESGQEPRVVPVLEISRKYPIRRIRALRSALAGKKGAVVHIHFPACFFDPSILLGIRLAGVKNLAATFHHPTPNLPRHAKIFRAALKLCRHVIFDTQENLEFSERDGFVAPGQGKVCRLGIDEPVRSDRYEARKKYNLTKENVIVGCLARQAPDKRVALLIESVKKALDRVPNLHLLVAGSGDLMGEIQDLGNRTLGTHFTHLGPLEDIQNFMASLDIFALPSELEGFGLVFIEAGAHEVPSIGCRGGGIANAILDGKTGFLTDPVSPVTEFTDRIVELGQNIQLRQQMGESAERHYLENYSLAATVAAHRELYLS